MLPTETWDPWALNRRSLHSISGLEHTSAGPEMESPETHTRVLSCGPLTIASEVLSVVTNVGFQSTLCKCHSRVS